MSGVTLKELRAELSRCAVEARRWKEAAASEPVEATITNATEPSPTDEDYDKPFQQRLPEHGLMELLDRPFVDVNHRFLDESTMLMRATSAGYKEVVDRLLLMGAKINLLNEDHYTALGLAIEFNEEEIAAKLIQKGADVDVLYRRSDFLVCVAAALNRLKTASLLLDHGANVNASAPPQQKTPLIIASYMGHTDMVSLLLKKGARVDLRDHEGESALTLATEMGFSAIKQLLLAQNEPEAAQLFFLPPHRVVARGDWNAARGLSIYGFAHRWDSFINAFVENPSTDRVPSVITHRFQAGGAQHAAILAYFMPFEDLRKLLHKDDALKADDAQESWVEVEKYESTEARNYCPLRIIYRKSKALGDMVTALLVKHVFGVLGAGPRNNDQYAGASEVWVSTLRRMDAALRACCVEISPRIVHRYIYTEATADEIVLQTRRRWTSTSTDDAIARRFCPEAEGPCVHMVIQVNPGTLGVFVPAVLKSVWQCHDEREVLLARSSALSLVSETNATPDAHRTIRCTVQSSGAVTRVSAKTENFWVV